MTLWRGRFGEEPSDELKTLSDSLAFDVRLFREDIAGSRAHATMLGKVGLLDPEEVAEIHAALETVESEIADGHFAFEPDDEDIHTAVERRVTELTPAGAKLHTGRSRNDQVAADLRLWTKKAITSTLESVLELEATLLDRAEQAGEAFLPGYTHLQHAQRVPLAHHLLAHGWALARDFERLAQARDRLDVSPLGAGAIAGTTLPVDPEITAGELGFGAVFENSLDAVSDRDFVAEALFALSLLGVHLSRIGEELVIWSSPEFAFVRPSERYSTGSSMLPQKANPDIAELARGKSGRLIGNLTGFLATLKGLPLAYNKDLQEDKEPLFDSFDTIRVTLGALNGMVQSLEFDNARMEQAASSPYLAATALAESLVEQGVPFREAHAIVGDLVRRSLIGEGSFEDLVESSGRFGDAALAHQGIPATGSSGGANLDSLTDQKERFAGALEAQAGRIHKA